MYLLIALLLIIIIGFGLVLAYEPWRQQYLTQRIFRRIPRAHACIVG